MAKLAADKFLELVKQSSLVEPDELAQSLADLEASSGKDAVKDADLLVNHLQAAGLITAWQCDKLMDGKHKGFFLKNYKLLGHIGTGGMSSVYLAEHTMMHCPRAIKVLPISRVDDSSYLARFKQEAIAAAQLNHPNIVQAFDIAEQDGRYYIVMEYVEGRDLQKLVKDTGPVEFDTAANYLRQAAEGLAYAHHKGLIHRDIKPANLLVDGRGVVKLLDLGLARFVDQKMPSLTIAHDENVLGTADYLAPEQAVDSHGVDSRADLYSLGCTFYYLLTGHPPFPTGTLPQRIYMHQNKAPASIYEDRPDAPQALVDLCLRMMAKTPEARCQTADEIAAALTTWLAARNSGSAGGGGGNSSEPRGRPAPPPRRGATALAKPPRRDKPTNVDDTLADIDRETIKGGPRPQTAYNPGRAEARPGEPKLSDSRDGIPTLSGSDSSVRKGPRKASDSDRSLTTAHGLPRAQSLSPAAGAKGEEAGNAVAGSRNSSAGLRKGDSSPTLDRRLGDRRGAAKKPNSIPLPKWLWPWGVVGMFSLALIMLVVFWILSRSAKDDTSPPHSSPAANQRHATDK